MQCLWMSSLDFTQNIFNTLSPTILILSNKTVNSFSTQKLKKLFDSNKSLRDGAQ